MDRLPPLETMSNALLPHAITLRRGDAERALFAYTQASLPGKREEVEILLSEALISVEEHEREAERRCLPVGYWPKRRAILDVLAQAQAARTSPRETNDGVLQFTEIDTQYARAFGIRLD